MRSAAEKQPQENDQRDRHAKQPKQKSSSYLKPPPFLFRDENAGGRRLVPAAFRRLLPVAGVRHRTPWLGRWLGLTLLQQLDRMQIGRAHEGHVAIARRTVDGDAELHQPIAGRVDVVALIGEVAEMAGPAIYL